MNNYFSLVNMKYKASFFIFIILLILIIIIALSSVLKTYDYYTIYGIYNNNLLIINVPIENSDAVNNSEQLIINKKKYNYSISSISALLVEDNINYQEYEIKINNVLLKENEIVKITFYYNKQTIMQKIISFIF